MTTVQQTSLPGVGIRYEFQTKAGDQVGVIAHHSGRYDFLLYDSADPDSCAAVMRLDGDDAHTLTELLGGSRLTESVHHLHQDLPGVALDWAPISPGWRCIGSTIQELAIRNRTGASVVAVVRNQETLPAPGPDFQLLAGDTAVLVGTPLGIQQALHLLQDGN